MEQPNQRDMDLPLKQVRPVVLGVLQNQWFYDPPKIIAMIEERHARNGPEAAERFRRRMIEYALFAGCQTGRRLREGLGECWCNRIVWENASKRIGNFSSSCFPADPDHIRRVVLEVKPDIVVAFGKVATEAFNPGEQCYHVAKGLNPYEFIETVHPAARGLNNPMEELTKVKRKLDFLSRFLAIEAK